MENLKIRKIIYSGDNYFFESPLLKDGIVLIEGFNGTGKTTLCDLIYFAFGGKVEKFNSGSEEYQKEIAGDTNNYVDLYIYLSEEPYLIRRFFANNNILVSSFTEQINDNGKIELTILPDEEKDLSLSINRSPDNKNTFSDWILQKLKIEPVEVHCGYRSFMINFTDLMRLMYYDQPTDANEIYKKPDEKRNFVNDSKDLRKAVFELLIGEKFNELYKTISNLKLAEKNKNLTKSLLDEYSNLAIKIRGEREKKNSIFLQKEVEELEKQLERLHSHRKTFKQNRHKDSYLEQNIQEAKRKLSDAEIELSDESSRIMSLYSERKKIKEIEEETIASIEQIMKVIFTHNQLGLFTPDTCPYCLTKVERPKNHCVCGSKIEEERYERFFYTQEEYNDILKSKIKSYKTVQIAINDCNSEILKTQNKIISLKETSTIYKENLKKYLFRIDETIDLETINDIDDEILKVRQEIADLHNILEIESKYESYQEKYSNAKCKVTDLESEKIKKELQAQDDIKSKIKDFNTIYNLLMKNTLQSCSHARISIDDYMPQINEGEYREHSANVQVRLMYFLTLLKLSIDNTNIPFPRFLLIDTPQANGIEHQNLIKCLEEFEKIKDKKCQVILTTGIHKYPEGLLANRVLFMPSERTKLLKKKLN
ncbi:MAG: hypothetical protein CMP22_07095 [Rickettsiales bacterium]|nr:hypothetical protein [Rickettsiales bacterium]